MKRPAFSIPLALALTLLAAASASADDKDPFRVLEPGKQPHDSRLDKLKNLDGYFPMTVPASKEAWEARRKELREQVLVALGLWPLPEKTPLNPVIHGKIDRDDYTVEKVFFAGYPGHYVCGNLYRPRGKTGKLPAVLCPHGHWANGRFYDAQTAHNEAYVQNQIKIGAEKTVAGARYPLQARCAQLARMGCVVFHYDMVGYADSQQLGHREGFTDADAELRLQSFMGLQAWNSIRALDFLLGLPEVDPKRVGVTGASGGGTQTFILCGIDDRPAAAFPAVMVSTAMQGGCICENCDYLRQNAGNIDFAALMVPKPLGMTGANDWTREIEKKGLPELQALYKLYGAEDNVMARAFLQFDHNYNQVSREVMYNFFNKHLHLGQKEPVTEKPFEPVPPRELSVFDEQHPRPADAVGAEKLRKYLSETSDKQMLALRPKDADGLKEYRRVIGTALRVLIGDRLPESAEVEAKEVGDKEERDGLVWRKYLLGRKGSGEQVPAVGVKGKDFDGTVAVWVHPAGKSSLWQDGKLAPAARKLLDGKAAILAVDVFMTGEFEGAKLPEVEKRWAGYAGYNYGYNRPLAANRVHDILTAVAFARGHDKTKAVHLVGFDKAGPWVLLARGLCGDAVSRTAADADRFRFDSVRTLGDEMLLPGALKYGGLGALAAVAAPAEVYIHNHQGTGVGGWLKPAYASSGLPDRLQEPSPRVADDKVAEWLLR
jgi:dienelactone hydrolase